MMSYSIAGGVSMGAAQFNESQLDRLISRIRTGMKKSWRCLKDILSQRGNPL